MTIAYDCNLKSSNIHGVAYDIKAGIGYVEFNGGRRFAYKMPKALFDQMRNAKSIGSFFAREIKGKCPVVWTGFCCDNSPCRSDAFLQGSPGNDAKHGIFKVCEPCSKIARLANIVFTPIPESR